MCGHAENFDMRKNQLTRQGFMELNLMEATEKDGDPADLWVTLEAMGYNRQLELVDVGGNFKSHFKTGIFNRQIRDDNNKLVILTLNTDRKSSGLELLFLSLHQACPFLIDVHCEVSQPSTQPLTTTSGPRLLNQALQKSITSRTGAKALRGQDSVFIYTYRGEHRISSLIANKVEDALSVDVTVQAEFSV